MHLERQAEFGDISWTREWPAGALFTSAQPVPHGIGMGDQKISDPRIFESASDLLYLSGAKGTRTPGPTRQNTDSPLVSLHLVPIRSCSLPAVSFSGLDGVKSGYLTHRPAGPLRERSRAARSPQPGLNWLEVSCATARLHQLACRRQFPAAPANTTPHAQQRAALRAASSQPNRYRAARLRAR
jgi:hypothetical protein